MSFFSDIFDTISGFVSDVSETVSNVVSNVSETISGIFSGGSSNEPTTPSQTPSEPEKPRENKYAGTVSLDKWSVVDKNRDEDRDTESSRSEPSTSSSTDEDESTGGNKYAGTVSLNGGSGISVDVSKITTKDTKPAPSTPSGNTETKSAAPSAPISTTYEPSSTDESAYAPAKETVFVQTAEPKQYAPSHSWDKNYENPADEIPHTLENVIKDDVIYNNGVYLDTYSPENRVGRYADYSWEDRGEAQANVLYAVNEVLYNGIGSPAEKTVRNLLSWREGMYNTAAKYEEEGDYIRWALSYLPAFAVDCIAPLDAIETGMKLKDGKSVEQYELDISSVDLAISCIPLVGAGIKAVGKIVTKVGEKAALNVAEEAAEKTALNAGEKTAINAAEEAGEKTAKNAAEEAGEKAGKTKLSRAVGIGTTAASVGGTLLQFSLYPDDETPTEPPTEPPKIPDEDDTEEYDEYIFEPYYGEQYGEFDDVLGGASGGGSTGAGEFDSLNPFAAAVSAGIGTDTDQIIQKFGKTALIAAVLLLIFIALNAIVSKKGEMKHYG